MSPYLVFLLGLSGLLVAGHLLVTGAITIGRRLGLTPTVIGLTIVAAGTSGPELAVFAEAVRVDDTELAVGSIVGSNIANVLLVLGLVAAAGAVRLAARVVRIDVPVMVGASLLLLLFAADGMIRPYEGSVLLAAVVGFVGFTVRSSRRSTSATVSSAGAAATEDSQGVIAPSSRKGSVIDTTRGLGFVAAGVAGLMLSANHVVRGAERIAADLGVPELIVGLTVVALGTSAPEIVTSLLAAVRGERELAVGNAIGSNIFNILLVIGLSGLFAGSGIAISPDVVAVDLPIMVAAAVACLPLLYWDHKLDRWEGFVFLAYYAAYTGFLVLTATEHGATETYVAAMLWFVLPLTVLTVATIVHRGRSAAGRRPGLGRSARRPIPVPTRTPSKLSSAVVPARSRPKEVSRCSPSHVNPLLLMHPSRNRSAGSDGRR